MVQMMTQIWSEALLIHVNRTLFDHFIFLYLITHSQA